MKRKMYAQASLYPASCEDCEAMFSDFNAKLDHALGENTLPNFTPRAVVVPHAGFLYSGYTANFTYRMLQEKSAGKKRIIVLGKSEKARFLGISGSFYKKYKTPCGKLKIDIDYLDMLRTTCAVSFVESAHKERVTEVQMPFIKHYLSELKVVELLYDDVDQASLEKLLSLTLADEENIVVVCTNLGDLQEQKELGIIDATYLNALSTLESGSLHEGCNASGIMALKALMESAKRGGFTSQILNYQTSSINTAEKVRVEGHLSVALY